jgi:hypothetical protein
MILSYSAWVIADLANHSFYIIARHNSLPEHKLLDLDLASTSMHFPSLITTTFSIRDPPFQHQVCSEKI